MAATGGLTVTVVVVPRESTTNWAVLELDGE
jgi:hypothetical protein